MMLMVRCWQTEATLAFIALCCDCGNGLFGYLAQKPHFPFHTIRVQRKEIHTAVDFNSAAVITYPSSPHSHKPSKQILSNFPRALQSNNRQ